MKIKGIRFVATSWKATHGALDVRSNNDSGNYFTFPIRELITRVKREELNDESVRSRYTSVKGLYYVHRT
jgi:hypothetical protein